MNLCSGILAVASIVVACGSDHADATAPGTGDGGALGTLIPSPSSGADGGHAGAETSDPSPGPQDAASPAPDATPDAFATPAPEEGGAFPLPEAGELDQDASASAQDADTAGEDVDAETGPQVCGFTACAPGAPCPDLVIDQDDLASSVLIEEQTFAATDCAIVDGCITQTGTRRLLRFDTGIANVGTGDLTIGDPASNACFQWSQCHEHYHFKGVGEYTLYEADGTTVAAVGHKQGFCMEDVVPAPFDPGPTPATRYSCTNQGLHVGWEDVYPNDLDCQWVDITGVPSGSYILSVHINAQQYLPESNYDNDVATVNVTIP